MSKNRKSRFSLLAVLLCALFITESIWFSRDTFAAEKGSVLESRILKTGEKAPIFQGEQLGGGEFDLSQHVGEKPVVIFFWSFFCGPCMEEMPILHRVYEDLGRDSVSFISINLDGVKLSKAIEKFMENSNLIFTTVFDELIGLEYKIADAYGVSGTPTLYLIDPDGKIALSIVGLVEPEELKGAIERSMGKTL